MIIKVVTFNEDGFSAVYNGDTMMFRDLDYCCALSFAKGASHVYNSQGMVNCRIDECVEKSLYESEYYVVD